jgi:hypothetical protein
VKEKHKEKIEKIKTIIKQNTKLIHLTLLIVTALLFLAGVFVLLRWNRGVDSDYDAAETTDAFDVEELDFVMPFDPTQIEGYEDDGELHILCLGNNPFSDDTGPRGLAAMIAEETGGITYNGAFPDSTVASKTSVQEPQDAFSLYYVTIALVNNYFSFLRQYAYKVDDPRYLEAANVLDDVDMKKIDVIIIMYDSTDYNEQTLADDPHNSHNMNAYSGAMRCCLELLQKFFPYIRIIVMSQTYAQYRDAAGELHNGTITDPGNGDAVLYLVMQYYAAFESSVTFIDNYFGTINEENYRDYMIDHMRYNEAGRRLLAQRVAAVVNE